MTNCTHAIVRYVSIRNSSFVTRNFVPRGDAETVESGPILRASGVDFDLRRDEPYSVYDKFDFNVPVYQNGDVFDRYMIRLDEIQEACKIIRQALDGLPEGEIKGKVKPKFKPDPGEVYVRIENSRGEMGVYLQSDGSDKPLRMKARGGSYNHLQLLPHISTDCLIADLVAIFASFDVILPEVDR